MEHSVRALAGYMLVCLLFFSSPPCCITERARVAKRAADIAHYIENRTFIFAQSTHSGAHGSGVCVHGAVRALMH